MDVTFQVRVHVLVDLGDVVCNPNASGNKLRPPKARIDLQDACKFTLRDHPDHISRPLHETLIAILLA